MKKKYNCTARYYSFCSFWWSRKKMDKFTDRIRIWHRQAVNESGQSKFNKKSQTNHKETWNFRRFLNKKI